MQPKDSGIVSSISIFYSYAHEDEALRDELEKHLILLRHQGIVSQWHDRQILAGTDWAQSIDNYLNIASIILLLVSPDFLASAYCYGIEMKRALERHLAGTARVIPIILRPVDWSGAPFAHLQCLPRDAEPIMLWNNRDAAFRDVARSIREIVNELKNGSVIFRVQESEEEIGLSFSTPPFVDHPRPDRSGFSRPRTYIPFARNPLFQPRPNEFERLERLLFKSEEAKKPVRLGLIGVVGMGGVGKTQLAIELAYGYRHRFPAGIFWMPAAGRNHFEWQHRLAELAFNAEYLPPEDDVLNPENEARRARHFCRYLSSHPDALLILDNVEDPYLVNSVLPALAGGEVACAILYTSRMRHIVPGVSVYPVERLLEEGSLRLLLEVTRPSLLDEVLTGGRSTETQAAHDICQEVGYLPLALVHLRGLLAQDSQVTLVRLHEVLRRRGALELAKTSYGDAASLFATFQLSWEKVSNEKAQLLFKLASYFPEAVPIPLWLLGLAAGLGERGDIFEPLGEACMQLRELSLLEALSGDQVLLHPLVREFGKWIVEEDGRREIVVNDVERRLVAEFTDLYRLEYRACHDYWRCFDQVRGAREYKALKCRVPSLSGSHGIQVVLCAGRMQPMEQLVKGGSCLSARRGTI